MRDADRLVAVVLVAWLCAGVAAAQLSLTVERTIWVSGTGTPAENCTALRNTLDSIPGPATLENAYLVKVGPGRYDCGLTTVNVPLYVTVEGAGIEVTEITGEGDSPTSGVVSFDQTTGGFAELRSLTVRHLGGAIDWAIAVSVRAPNVVRLEDVVLLSRSGPTHPIALRAVETEAGAVRAIAQNAELQAPTAAQAVGDATIELVLTRVNGAIVKESGGSIKCAGSFTATFIPLNSSCSP